MRPVYTVGDRVSTDHGKGRVIQVIQRNRHDWTHAEYYLVKLDKHDKPHLFARTELKNWYGLSSIDRGLR